MALYHFDLVDLVLPLWVCHLLTAVADAALLGLESGVVLSGGGSGAGLGGTGVSWGEGDVFVLGEQGHGCHVVKSGDGGGAEGMVPVLPPALLARHGVASQIDYLQLGECLKASETVLAGDIVGGQIHSSKGVVAAGAPLDRTDLVVAQVELLQAGVLFWHSIDAVDVIVGQVEQLEGVVRAECGRSCQPVAAEVDDLEARVQQRHNRLHQRQRVADLYAHQPQHVLLHARTRQQSPHELFALLLLLPDVADLHHRGLVRLGAGPGRQPVADQLLEEAVERALLLGLLLALDRSHLPENILQRSHLLLEGRRGLPSVSRFFVEGHVVCVTVGPPLLHRLEHLRLHHLPGRPTLQCQHSYRLPRVHSPVPALAHPHERLHRALDPLLLPAAPVFVHEQPPVLLLPTALGGVLGLVALLPRVLGAPLLEPGCLHSLLVAFVGVAGLVTRPCCFLAGGLAVLLLGEAVQDFRVADRALLGEEVGQVGNQLCLAQLPFLLEGLDDGVEGVEAFPLETVQVVYQCLDPDHVLPSPPLLLHEHLADQNQPGGHVEPLPQRVVLLGEVGCGLDQGQFALVAAHWRLLRLDLGDAVGLAVVAEPFARLLAQVPLRPALLVGHPRCLPAPHLTPADQDGAGGGLFGLLVGGEGSVGGGNLGVGLALEEEAGLLQAGGGVPGLEGGVVVAGGQWGPFACLDHENLLHFKINTLLTSGSQGQCFLAQ